MGHNVTMDVNATVEAHCEPDAMRAWIHDLDRYPQWLSIVPRADRLDGTGDAAVWEVELRAKVGPIARSKKLRMRRVIDEPDHVRFERDEIDGRQHSPWVLDAVVEPLDGSVRLVMDLHYGGSFGGGLVERLLSDEIESSKEKLRSLVERGPHTP